MPVDEQYDLEKVSGDMFSFPGRYTISKSKQDSSMRQRMILSFLILLFFRLSHVADSLLISFQNEMLPSQIMPPMTNRFNDSLSLLFI